MKHNDKRDKSGPKKQKAEALQGRGVNANLLTFARARGPAGKANRRRAQNSEQSPIDPGRKRESEMKQMSRSRDIVPLCSSRG
jgi:hypothetical protein